MAQLAWEDAATGGADHQAQANATEVTICEPDLAITKVADNTTPMAGDSLLYTVQVTNNGDWPAYNVTVNDTVEPVSPTRPVRSPKPERTRASHRPSAGTSRPARGQSRRRRY